MVKLFTKHPRSIGETYFQHMRFAATFGLNMVKGGTACLIHAIFPFIFQRTGSNLLLQMAHHFIERMPPEDEKIKIFAQLIQQKTAKLSS